MKRGPNAGSRFLLNRPITSAGRHAGSDIVLDDVTVGSLYGTYVNRELVESATLANGDKIYIGSFCLMVLKSRTTETAGENR